MKLQAERRKQIKFERIKQQFGCGYFAVCSRSSCPCKLKNREYNHEIYGRLTKEFMREEQELFGA